MALRRYFALGALGFLIAGILLHLLALQPFAEIAADGTYALLSLTAIIWFVEKQP